MNKVKAVIVSILLFGMGVGFQTIEHYTTLETISLWALLYIPLYIIGISFIPLYSIIKKRK